MAYQVEAFTSSHDFKGLCGCQSSNFWCPRSRTSRGINGVDIKAQIDGCVAPNLSTDLSHQGIERFVPTFFSPNYPPTLVATPLRITLFVPSPKIHNSRTVLKNQFKAFSINFAQNQPVKIGLEEIKKL